MTRRRSIWIIGVVLLIGALAVAAILYRDSLGREIVNAALKGTGYSVAGLSVESLSKDEVRLSDLTIVGDDGTRIVIKGVTLPVSLRDRRIESLAVDFIELIPSAADAEAASYAELAQLGLGAYRLAPDIEVRVGVLRVPWLPDMMEIAWSTTPDGQSIDFDIDEFHVDASMRAVDLENALAVTVTTADGAEALSWSASATSADSDLLLTGEVEASIEYWIRVLRDLGAAPEGLRTLEAKVYGNVSVLVPGDAGGEVKVGGSLWSDDDIDLSYATESGGAYAVAAAGLDALKWQFAWPSLDWTASLGSMESAVSAAGKPQVALQLSDIACRAGVECTLVVDYLARGLTRDKASLGTARATAPMVVEIGDTVSVRSARPMTIRFARIGYENWLLESLELNGTFSISGPDYSASLDFRSGEGISGQLEAVYDDESGKGSIKVVGATIDFDNTNASELFERWPYEWDVLRGRLRAEAELELAGAMTGVIDIGLADLAGSYGELAFAGLNVAATTRLGGASGLGVSPFDVRLALVDVGFPVEDLRARISPDTDENTIGIDGVEMRTLGGRITVDPFVYSLAAETNQLVVRPAGVQLQLIVDLVSSDAVNVEGSVSGMIPVSISEQGITADSGRVESDPRGGVIRFPSGIPGLGGTNGSSQVGIVTQALSNFEFTSLTSDVTYTTAGDLLLKMRIEGFNPEMDPNQPVILNLGLEDNVPQLLKSLQAARSISDILGRRFAN